MAELSAGDVVLGGRAESSGGLFLDRVLVMQQADAPEAFSVSWMPGAAAERLQQYPRTQLIMHSGLTVGRD